MTRPVAAALAVLAITWAVLLAVPPWSDEDEDPLDATRVYAALMLEGEIPYRDYGFQYPPLAAPAILIPGLAGTDPEDYRVGMAVFTVALAAALVLLVGALASRTGGSPRMAMLVAAGAPLLLGAVSRLHFDLAPLVLCLAALLALTTRRPALGMTLIGLAAMTKGFPLAIAPVALAWLWGTGDRDALRRGAAAIACTLVLIAGAWIAFSHDGAHDALEYNIERALQIESSPASAVLGLDAIGIGEVAVVDSRGSAGLDHPLAPLVRAVFALALVGALAALATLAARAGRTRSITGQMGAIDARAARGLVIAALAALAAVAAFAPVLLAHYLVWVVPLLALAVSWRLWALTAAVAAACVLTLIAFPASYPELVGTETLAALVVAARNAALITAVGLAVLALVRASGIADGERARPAS